MVPLLKYIHNLAALGHGTNSQISVPSFSCIMYMAIQDHDLSLRRSVTQAVVSMQSASQVSLHTLDHHHYHRLRYIYDIFRVTSTSHFSN